MSISLLSNINIDDRLNDEDPAVRRVTVIDLMDEGAHDNADSLIHALSDSDSSVREEAAKALEGVETSVVVSALCVALYDEVPEVCHAAATSLAELKDATLGEILLPTVNAKEAFVRAAGLRALRELRIEASFSPAMVAIEDSDANVRREAIGVLGYLKNVNALPKLAKLANDDCVEEVRRAAVGALGMTNADGAKDALARALYDPSWRVREEAALTAGKLKVVNLLPNLIEAMSDPYWQVRLKAAAGLGKLKHSDALPTLIEALEHSISNLRKEAALALGEIGDDQALPALDIALKDSDPEVRKAVRIAVQQIAQE